MEKRNFDLEAVVWDEEPRRVQLGKDLAEAVFGMVPVTESMDVLDFGCGTGLLGLQVLPRVRSVTGVDSSRGMLDVLNGKIRAHQLVNVKTQLVDLEKGDVLEGRYHLVVCGMTLHHIRDIVPLLREFYRVLLPGGWLCIADLDSEDGQFHGDNGGVFHLGFDRGALREMFVEVGFEGVEDRMGGEVVKPVASGEMRSFSVFLMVGRRGVMV